MGLRHMTWLVALAACAPRPLPRLDAIEPASAPEGTSVEVVVRGQDFWPQVMLDFDDPTRSAVRSEFTVAIGDAALLDATYFDARTVRARTPPTLTVGTFPVTFVDPWGRESRLDEAFTVTPAAIHLVVESRGGGAGTPVGDFALRTGQPLNLSAVGRTDSGAFRGDIADVTWTTTAGTLSGSTGASVFFSMSTPGVAVVTAVHPVFGPDSTGQLSVSACSSGSDCVDVCHRSGACQAGTCVLGPADKDSDGDGHVDALCGGADCDDSSSAANPTQQEGPAGTPTCADGFDNDCSGQADGVDPQCTPGNSHPTARLTVTPDAGIAGTTFRADGSASSDAEDPLSALVLEWDWLGDGRFLAPGVSSTHRYYAEGAYWVTLRVTDTRGARAFARSAVVVTTPSRVQVTTPNDESDPGATPVDPGGTGFSLREAIEWCNAASGRQIIELPTGTELRPRSRLPTISDAVTIVGHSAILDGRDIGRPASSCLEVGAASVSIDSLTVQNCEQAPLSLRGTSGSVTNCRFRDNREAVQIRGSSNTFGPGNEVFNTRAPAVDVANDNLVIDNSLHDNDSGASVSRGAATRVIGNRIYANRGDGVSLSVQADEADIFFNTIHGNAGSGVSVAANVSNLDVLNNLITSNQQWGLDAAAARFGRLDANDLFQNQLGACRACTGLGPRAIAVDPGYTAPAAADFRPRTTSPVIDVGLDVGVDRNGVRPGLFDGSAPDLGAFEVR